MESCDGMCDDKGRVVAYLESAIGMCGCKGATSFALFAKGGINEGPSVIFLGHQSKRTPALVAARGYTMQN